MADSQETVVQSGGQVDEADGGGWSITKIALVAGGVFVGIIVLIFVLALILALANLAEAERIIQLIRDFFVIVLTLEGILIIFAVVILIYQIARSVNLVQSEVKPILENAQDAVNAAKGSAEFVGKNAAGPIIRMLGFFSGLMVFIRELGGIRRAVRRSGDEDKREK
jgi:hypothetical protein